MLLVKEFSIHHWKINRWLFFPIMMAVSLLEVMKLKPWIFPWEPRHFNMKSYLKSNGVYVFSSNYALYGDMSRRVMNILSRFTPDIEIYSIDEAFLLLEGFEEHFDLHAYGREMIKAVRSRTGIPISIGIAPTKALAKVANKIAKKFAARTGGVYIIDDPEKTKESSYCGLRSVMFGALGDNMKRDY